MLPAMIDRRSKSNPVAKKVSNPKQNRRAPEIDVAKMIKGRSNALSNKAPIMANAAMTNGRIIVALDPTGINQLKVLKRANPVETPPIAPNPRRNQRHRHPDSKIPTTPKTRTPIPRIRSKFAPKLWACKCTLIRIMYPKRTKRINPVAPITKRKSLIPKKLRTNPKAKQITAHKPVNGV